MAHSASEIRLWAWSANNINADYCEDARLRGDSDEEVDKSYGQALWDLALPFANAKHLAELLKTGVLPAHLCSSGGFGCSSTRCGPLKDVSMLAIVAHGQPGVVDIDCKAQITYGGVIPPGTPALTPHTIDQYKASLTQIGNVMKKGGTIMFMSCWAARGTINAGPNSGSNLLIRLSEIWRDINVAGIVTMGYVGAHDIQGRRTYAGTHTEAGVRATNVLNPYDRPTTPTATWEQVLKHWSELSALPWAAPGIPHAKVALNGKIIKDATDDTDNMPA